MPSPPGPVDRRRLSLVTFPAGGGFHRVYELKYGYDDFNPGQGSSRFAPFVDSEGHVVPTLYGGSDPTVTLLETVYHEIGLSGLRLVYERALRDRGLAYVSTPVDLHLIDLRDDALRHVGLARPELVATDPAHYACTREWAAWFHGLSIRGVRADGLIWHSRKGELLPGSSHREVFVLFGDRAPHARGSYALTGPGVRNLVEGPGRVLVDTIATQLGATVVPIG